EGGGGGAGGGAPGARPFRPPEAELIAHGTIDEELTQGRREAQTGGHRLAVRAQDLGALGSRAEVVEGAPLEGGGVGRPHLDGREHVLPDARRGEHGGGPQLS